MRWVTENGCLPRKMLTALPGVGAGGTGHKQLCCAAAGVLPPWAEAEADPVGQQLSSEARGMACTAVLYLEIAQSLLISSQVPAGQLQSVLQVRLTQPDVGLLDWCAARSKHPRGLVLLCGTGQGSPLPEPGVRCHALGFAPCGAR